MKPQHRDLLARGAAAVWLFAMLVVFFTGTFGSDAMRTRLAEDGPGCPFRTATSIECAFCGMTRATLAMGQGDFGRAFDLHPLAPLVLVLSTTLCVIIVAGRADRLLGGRVPQLIVGGVAVIWAIKLLA